MQLKKIILLLFLLLHISSFCQIRRNVDSLKIVLKKNLPQDTTLVTIYNDLAYSINRVNPDSSRLYAEKALTLSQKLRYKNGVATAYNLIGINYHLHAEYDKALAFYEKSKKIKEELKDYKGVISSQNNTGIVYYLQGKYEKALSYFEKSLALQKKIGDTTGMANTFNYIASVHFYQGDYEKALKDYLGALKIYEKKGEKNGMSQAYNNIGIVYKSIGNIDKAIENYLAALQISEALGDKYINASGYNNLGAAYEEKGEIDKALKYFTESLKLSREMNQTQGIAYNLINIGGIYQRKKEYDRALEYYREGYNMHEKNGEQHGMSSALESIGGIELLLGQLHKAQISLEKALQIAMNIQAKESISSCYRSLSELYKKKKDFKKSYEYLSKHAVLKDSMLSESKNKNMAEMQTRFDTDKKEKEIALLNKNKHIEELQSDEQLANIKKQKATIYASLGGISLALTLVFFVMRGNKQKKKANFLLEEKNEAISAQKKILEEKNTLITDSIEYAKSMQYAILPSPEIFKEQFTDSFILFKPKDLVSGDFYWLYPLCSPPANFSPTGEESVLLSAIDCVGHGVPGAFMALHGYNLLEHIVKEKKDLSPAEILDELNKRVITSLNQQNTKGANENSSAKYGMDLAMIKIHPAVSGKTKVEFAGARNPLVIIASEAPGSEESLSPFKGGVRQGRTGDVTELKADRMYIGGAIGNFTNQAIAVEKGSMLYLFTDGYADQKGGENGKKFFAESLRTLLKEIAYLPGEEQKTILEKTHNDWKAHREQIDDILLIGIRI